MNLTNCQQEACNAFFQFLTNPDEDFFIISGPGGTGKSYLLGYIVHTILPNYRKACALLNESPKYHNVVMTATTNKAAEVLGEAVNYSVQTIHSFLGLRVKENYTTGELDLIPTSNHGVKHNSIIFIDEASMIDRRLMEYIQDSTHNCKVIYVCDDKQLPPVREDVSGIFKQGINMVTLKEPVRNRNQPTLITLCNQFRDTVETGLYLPIQLVPGVVDYMHDEDMPAFLAQHFTDTQHTNKILCYSNNRVNEYNDYIREMRGLGPELTVGEVLVNNHTYTFTHSNGTLTKLQVEDEVTVLVVGEPHAVSIADGIELTVNDVTVQTFWGAQLTVPIPTDRQHFKALLKYYSKLKDWPFLFHLKNRFPDLRPRDACTVHKSQGSSYDIALIDVGNLSTCHIPKLATRLFYVAVSRAVNRVVFYGDLAPKYGTFLQP